MDVDGVVTTGELTSLLDVSSLLVEAVADEGSGTSNGKGVWIASRTSGPGKA